MAKSDPKNKIETVASKHAMKKPHLWKRGCPISYYDKPYFLLNLTMEESNWFCR